MASVTVNRKGKVTNVTNGTKSNTNMSDNYTVGQNTNYNTTKKVTSNAASNITQTPVPKLETQYTGSNVSADTPVIGSLDAPAYGMTTNNTPITGNTSKNLTGYKYNPSDDEISSLPQSITKDTSSNGTGVMGNVYGYGDPEGYYTTRQTAYTFENPDGTTKTVYSNATNYNTALEDAVNSGSVQSGAKLKYASTYGTGSLEGNNYNYGGTLSNGSDKSGFGNGSDGGRYLSDKQYGKMYDQNNMQLEYLSGRDSMDYSNPYAYAAYSGNGLSNAYNKGLQNAGTGNIAGAYGVGLAGVGNNTLAESGGLQYQGLTADDIASQYGSMANNYQNAIDDVNNSIVANYGYQTDKTNSDAQKAAQALYAQKAIAQRDLPQQLSAQGISGGLTESSLLGLNTNYQNAWQANEESRVDAVNQLKIAQQTAVSQNNLTAAQYLSELQQNSLQLQQQISSDMNNFNLSVAAAAQSAYESDRAYNYQVAQDSISNAYAAATLQQQETEAKYNAALQMGDYDTAAKLQGVSATHAKQMQAIELAAAQLDYDTKLYTLNAKKKKASSSSSSDAASNYKLSKTTDDLKTETKTGTVTSSALSNYAQGVYTDLTKGGYSPTAVDDYLTNQYKKGYITQNEAETLANRLIGA